jgi:paired amphipathic helix protein Sin3a
MAFNIFNWIPPGEEPPARVTPPPLLSLATPSPPSPLKPPTPPKPRKRKDSMKQVLPEHRACLDDLADAIWEIEPEMLKKIANGSAFKRPKQHHAAKQAAIPEPPVVSPTLVPQLPQPLPPSLTGGATPEELAFFDRVRKFLGNKNMMNEFLKLCNLFSQDLIDPNTLIHRAQAFIGTNAELMAFFKSFLHVNDKEEIIENRPRVMQSRVALANCRSYGPSYRLLPKQERNRPCSGRDELCRSVLNDEWASHPTWASEDAGFIAHKKNQHEEVLHRVEEERHDYDHNIESLARTIQLLEPIARQFRVMSKEDVDRFQLPPALGGQSEAIPRRVIFKIYGRETGHQVLENLFQNPYNVVPVLLNRLKIKLEEWKAAQREWQKIWHDSTNKAFWKSLDHQNANQKPEIKRQYQPKTLQNEIAVKYEEQKRVREIKGIPTPPYQHIHDFKDTGVLYDATHLVLLYASQSQAGDYDRLVAFFKEFVPMFAGLDPVRFGQKIDSMLKGSGAYESSDEDTPMQEGSSAVNSTRKRGGLLRDVFTRVRNGGSNPPGSRDSTPDVSSTLDEDGNVKTPNGETESNDGIEKWIQVPGGSDLTDDINPGQPYKRIIYTMYANLQIYCFFQVFAMLNDRLRKLKEAEPDVHEAVNAAQRKKPARELKMLEKEPEDYFGETGPDANYYKQMLELIQEFTKGDLESATLQDTLCRWYLRVGYNLYSIDKLFNSLTRSAIAIINSEGKDKTQDIYNLFRRDRSREETTYDDEINYRKQVEKLVKDGDLYRISFVSIALCYTYQLPLTSSQNQDRGTATVRLFKKDDLTYHASKQTREQQWRFYVASWQSVHPTERVDPAAVSHPFVKRPLKTLAELDDEEGASIFRDVKSFENLQAKLNIEYEVKFVQGTAEFLLKPDQARNEGVALAVEDEEEDGAEGAAPEADEESEEVVKERTNARMQPLTKINAWMKGADTETVDAKKADYEAAIKSGSGSTEDTEMAEAS